MEDITPPCLQALLWFPLHILYLYAYIWKVKTSISNFFSWDKYETSVYVEVGRKKLYSASILFYFFWRISIRILDFESTSDLHVLKFLLLPFKRHFYKIPRNYSLDALVIRASNHRSLGFDSNPASDLTWHLIKPIPKKWHCNND